MIVSSESVEMLEGIFHERYVEIRGDREDKWVELLNSHDCTVLTIEDIKESFQDLINFDSSVKSGLCVSDPHGRSIGVFQYVIVPREFAEKVLVLGGFPD